MKRKVFFSFHFGPDSWRAAQIRNAGVVEGDQPVTDNDWTQITWGGEKAIANWIDGQLDGKSCCVVLIGSATAGRKWINYEIGKAWNSQKGVVGIYVHNLKDRYQTQSIKGKNPFDEFTMDRDKISLSHIVRTYDPPYFLSEMVYVHIRDNLASWVEEAILIRQNY